MRWAEPVLGVQCPWTRDLMERADDGALQQPECALHSVRVNVSAFTNVLAFAVNDRLMAREVVGGLATRRVVVRHDDGAF